MKSCKLSKGVFERKSENLPHFDGKKRVKLAIIRAFVLLCQKCIVEFDKNVLFLGRVWRQLCLLAAVLRVRSKTAAAKSL
jgi:hypothetical protein